ncbi:hypothetical protein [uncultured Helicobacter sp.]|uniref:type II secretion system protein n=1 Tax=uncultured Helicobacter sp. TaxID=175537 RepID=UPI00262161BA|nr:hypothetical protein [uncultured Helicobacter sp.]
MKSINSPKTQRHRCSQSNGFIMLEVVFALAIVGVAFGILAHFYLTRSHTGDFPVAELDTLQERALQDLESKLNAKVHTIVGTDGAFCEGQLFSTTQSQSTLKFFVPTHCDKP